MTAILGQRVTATLDRCAVDLHAVQSYMFGQSPTTVDYECSCR